MGEGAQRVEVNLVRDAGIRTGRLDGFMVVLPTVIIFQLVILSINFYFSVTLYFIGNDLDVSQYPPPPLLLSL